MAAGVLPKPGTKRERESLRKALRFTRILASYGCAGIDQEPDDPKLCGKCGPCEAAAFLAEIGKR